MSSRSVVPVGRQAPRVSLVPKSARSDADDAVFLAAGYGLVPDEWQALVLEGWLGRLRNGQWSAGRCGLAVPRQNGKNGVLEVRELFGVIALGEKFLHTAHEVKTARKAFARLKFYFGESVADPGARFPELNALVREIRSTNGQEAIFLRNGGSVEFVARSRGSGRGFTVDVLVCDEAQELTDEQLEALLPTISSSPLRNPQMILTGTPPSAIAQGDVFTRTRNAGVEGTATRLCWHEWSIPPGQIDVYDRRYWYDTNPALGIRLQLTVIEDELPPGMSPEGFSRERLGRWTVPGESYGPFPTGSWDACQDAGSTIADGSPLCVGVDLSWNRDTAYIVVAGRRQDGDVHVELVAQRAGTEWIIPWLTGVTAAGVPRQFGGVVVQTNGAPISSLTEDMKAAGLPVIDWAGADLGRASGQLFDLVKTTTVHHLPQPSLDVAAQTARMKPLGDSWIFDRKHSPTDCAPLIAAAGAIWGLGQVKAPFRSKYEDAGMVSV